MSEVVIKISHRLMDQNAFDRLESLIEMGKGILESATTGGGRLRKGFVTQETYRTPISYGIDIQSTSQWRTSCLYLLESLCGKESVYYKSFDSRMSQLIYGRVKMALGILIAVKDDYQLEKVMPHKSENLKTLEEWAGSQHLSWLSFLPILWRQPKLDGSSATQNGLMSYSLTFPREEKSLRVLTPTS